MKNKNRKLTLAIISSMVIVLFFSGFSMGKEIANKNLKTNTNIATPILKVENSDTLNIGNNTESGTYEFTVKNYDEQGNINQVDLEYYVEILTDINPNISFKIYKDGDELEMEENKTEKFSVKKDDKQTDTYRVLMTISNNKEEFEQSLQEMILKIHAEQKNADDLRRTNEGKGV